MMQKKPHPLTPYTGRGNKYPLLPSEMGWRGFDQTLGDAMLMAFAFWVMIGAGIGGAWLILMIALARLP
jgi:hypothetical protein